MFNKLLKIVSIDSNAIKLDIHRIVSVKQARSQDFGRERPVYESQHQKEEHFETRTCDLGCIVLHLLHIKSLILRTSNYYFFLCFI